VTFTQLPIYYDDEKSNVLAGGSLWIRQPVHESDRFYILDFLTHSVRADLSPQACYFVYQSTKRINVSRDSAARKQIHYFRHFTLFLISSFSFHDSICVLICTVFMDPMHVSMSKLPL
jgi:hypothetical protein